MTEGMTFQQTNRTTDRQGSFTSNNSPVYGWRVQDNSYCRYQRKKPGCLPGRGLGPDPFHFSPHFRSLLHQYQLSHRTEKDKRETFFVSTFSPAKVVLLKSNTNYNMRWFYMKMEYYTDIGIREKYQSSLIFIISLSEKYSGGLRKFKGFKVWRMWCQK